MKLTPEEIKQAVADGKITAISLDTSIFDRQGRKLDSGLLKGMRQFRDTDVTVVLSDIVTQELTAHLAKDARDAATKLKTALKHLEETKHISARDSNQTTQSLLGGVTPQDNAQSRLDEFVRKTEAEVIQAGSTVTTSEVLDRYFSVRPPFRDVEAKRNEFPDAYALLSLENWAAENDTGMLVVSADGDWEAYCAESPRLVWLGDLGTALGCFQDERAQYLCRELSVSLRKGDPHSITDAVKTAIKEQEDNMEVSVEADSQFGVADESAEVAIEFKGIQASETQPALEPVEFDGNTLVARMHVDASAKITGYFSLQKWDSIDKEFIAMGSAEATSDEEVTLEVLLTIAGDIEHKPDIENIEVIAEGLHASFTDVEPDWMGDRANFDVDH